MAETMIMAEIDNSSDNNQHQPFFLKTLGLEDKSSS